MKVEDMKQHYFNTYGIQISDNLGDWKYDRRRRSYWVKIPRIVDGDIILKDNPRYQVHHCADIPRAIKFYIKRDFAADPESYLERCAELMKGVKES